MARILVIEDSTLTRTAIRKALWAEGHEVIEVIDGQQSLDQITFHQPDCVLLDLLMPDFSGKEILQILNTQYSETPIIVLADDIHHCSRQEYLNLGAIAVLHKPLTPKELYQAVEMALNYTTA